MDEVCLAEYLGAQSGGPVDVHGTRPLPAGPEREMHIVDTSVGRFVVRIESSDAFGTSIGYEFNLMRSLHDARFPVARVRWFEPTGEVLGQPFFVMDHIEAPALDADATRVRAHAEALVRTLATLHGLNPAGHVEMVEARQAIHSQIERWRNVGKAAGGLRAPLLDAAEMFLHRHAPVPPRLSLIHGYATPSSVLAADESTGIKVLALTGWEFAHLGDPAEDWAFCMSMGNSPAMPKEAWMSMIGRVAGVRMTAPQWDYWEAFNLFKAACITRSCLSLFEAGIDRSPRMAINGTVVHRTFVRRLATLTA